MDRPDRADEQRCGIPQSGRRLYVLRRQRWVLQAELCDQCTARQYIPIGRIDGNNVRTRQQRPLGNTDAGVYPGYGFTQSRPGQLHRARRISAMGATTARRRSRLPFPVSLYGVPYTDAQIDSNGVLAFTQASSTFSNSCLPGDPYTDAIFAHWDDLRTDNSGAGCAVYPGGTCGIFTGLPDRHRTERSSSSGGQCTLVTRPGRRILKYCCTRGHPTSRSFTGLWRMAV